VTDLGDRRRAARLAAAVRLAARQDGVLGRRQAYRLGVTRWQVAAQLRARRWRRTGPQTVMVTTGPVSPAARRWIAVLEVGPRAALDGISSLQVAGLQHVASDVVHVVTPKSSTPRKAKGVRVHESRRYCSEDVLTYGVPRTRPAVAAVHAALWAASDRQAALFVVAAVQQRLVSVDEVARAAAAVRRHPRRRLLQQLLVDLAAGAESLGELDLTAGLRRRGLPQPSRQVVLRRSSGVACLDLDWDEQGVTLEVDGAQQELPANRLQDVLRDLDVAATGRLVIHLPLWALRLDEEAVLDRLAQLLTARSRRRAA
jgi:hypothetical protein